MQTYRFDFMGWRHLASAASLCLVILSMAALSIRGLDFGIEFTGGALFEVHFPAPVQLDDVRRGVEQAGFMEATVQVAGSDRQVVIRVPAAPSADIGALSGSLLAPLERIQAGASIINSEVIGPAVGEELRDSAILGALAAFAVVGIYIMFRFAGKFAVGATVALVHDVVVTLGAFVLLGAGLRRGSLRRGAGHHRLLAQRHHRGL